MTKRTSAKHKIDRRLSCNLWGRPKSPFNKRNTKPGQHGAMAMRKKQSDYGNQLFAKQKLKFYYGDLTEKQFKSTFAKASNIKGDTSEILIELLERVFEVQPDEENHFGLMTETSVCCRIFEAPSSYLRSDVYTILLNLSCFLMLFLAIFLLDI